MEQDQEKEEGEDSEGGNKKRIEEKEKYEKGKKGEGSSKRVLNNENLLKHSVMEKLLVPSIVSGF